MASSFLRFVGHTQRRTTVGRTPLNEWSARRREHTKLVTDKYICPRRDSEPATPASERPHTNALDRSVTNIYTHVRRGLPYKPDHNNFHGASSVQQFIAEGELLTEPSTYTIPPLSTRSFYNNSYLCSLTFRNRASYIGRAHRYPPNTPFYIFFQ